MNKKMLILANSKVTEPISDYTFVSSGNHQNQGNRSNSLIYDCYLHNYIDKDKQLHNVINNLDFNQIQRLKYILELLIDKNLIKISLSFLPIGVAYPSQIIRLSGLCSHSVFNGLNRLFSLGCISIIDEPLKCQKVAYLVDYINCGTELSRSIRLECLSRVKFYQLNEWFHKFLEIHMGLMQQGLDYNFKENILNYMKDANNHLEIIKEKINLQEKQDALILDKELDDNQRFIFWEQTIKILEEKPEMVEGRLKYYCNTFNLSISIKDFKNLLTKIKQSMEGCKDEN